VSCSASRPNTYATFGFALEDQTRPVYDGRFWGSRPNTYVVAHENAHQWFGDSAQQTHALLGAGRHWPWMAAV